MKYEYWINVLHKTEYMQYHNSIRADTKKNAMRKALDIAKSMFDPYDILEVYIIDKPTPDIVI